MNTVFKPRSSEELMQANCIVKHYAGSKAYGTNIATSDTDFRGIFLADEVNIRTPFYPVREVNDASEEDTKLYELFQFMKLALDCNPNVIETLWVDQSSITVDTPAYQLLRSHRDYFMSKKVAFTTSGYAFGQLKRIKGHNKWINNPQSDTAPRQIDYVSLVHNFTQSKEVSLKHSLDAFEVGYRLVPYGHNVFGVYQADGKRLHTNGSLNDDYEGDTHELGTPVLLVKYNAEQYRTAMETWQNYWSWKKNRNVARSELEELFGYDTKHAMHLVRLLRMGKEVLTTEQFNVKRHDAAELLEIRNGAWKYEELVTYAESLDAEIKKLVSTSKLRARPDMEVAANVIMQIQDLTWKK